jgi:hypothetical protein
MLLPSCGEMQEIWSSGFTDPDQAQDPDPALSVSEDTMEQMEFYYIWKGKCS